jgi:hypothetical protein
MMTFVVLVLGIVFLPPQAQAEDLRDFLVTSAYGTLTGAMVGALSLAFVDNPTSQVNNIAKGASLGIYAGVAWGSYRAYQADRFLYQPKSRWDLESRSSTLQKSWALSFVPGFRGPSEFFFQIPF